MLLELVVKPPTKSDQDGDGVEDEEDDEDEDGIVKDVACCLVCIRPNRKSRNKGHPVWFWWEMSLIEMPAAPVDEDFGHGDDLVSSTTALSLSVASAGGSSGSSSSSSSRSSTSTTRWMVDCIQPDFEDLDFETESLSIDNFLEGEEDKEEGDDDDDDGELTIYWDFNM